MKIKPRTVFKIHDMHAANALLYNISHSRAVLEWRIKCTMVTPGH